MTKPDVEKRTFFTKEEQHWLIIFGAASLFFATLEYLIPKPIPFFRIGLSNLPLILALPLFRGRVIFSLTILKVLGQGLVGGTLASYVFLFSAGGSLASVIAMYLVWLGFRSRIGWYGLALIGAMASNVVQIILSLVWIFGPTARVIAPVFMGLGLGAGLLVGILAASIASGSTWYRGLLLARGQGLVLPPTRVVEQDASPRAPSPSTSPKKRRGLSLSLPNSMDILGRNLSNRHHLLLAMVCLPGFLLQDSLVVKSSLVLLWIFLAMAGGKRLQPLYFLSMVGTITVFSLLNPAGLVLVKLGDFPITQGALDRGLVRGLGIVGMVFISLAAVRPGLRLPGFVGEIMTKLLFCYEQLLVIKRTAPGESFISMIDRAMGSLDSKLQGWDQSAKQDALGTTGLGFVLGLVLIALHWVPLIFTT